MNVQTGGAGNLNLGKRTEKAGGRKQHPENGITGSGWADVNYPGR